MLPDPKTPEERLSEARKELHRRLRIAITGKQGREEDEAIIMTAADHLATLAVLVGRIQQVDRDMRTAGQGGGWNHVITGDLRRERDRLLAELEKCG